jgi:hypothetical protein
MDVSVIARFPEAVYKKRGLGSIHALGEGKTTAVATVQAIRDVFKHSQMRHMHPNYIYFELAVGGMPHFPEWIMQNVVTMATPPDYPEPKTGIEQFNEAIANSGRYVLKGR